MNGHKCIVVPTPENLETIQQLNLQLMVTPDAFEKIVHQTDILETTVIDSKGSKICVRKSQRQLDLRVSWEVFNRDNYKCRYCGAGNGTPLTYDHIITWESGGPTTVENGVTSCKKCNNTRGNTTINEWLDSSYYKSVSAQLTKEILTKNEELRNLQVDTRKSSRKR